LGHQPRRPRRNRHASQTDRAYERGWGNSTPSELTRLLLPTKNPESGQSRQPHQNSHHSRHGNPINKKPDSKHGSRIKETNPHPEPPPPAHRNADERSHSSSRPEKRRRKRDLPRSPEQHTEQRGNAEHGRSEQHRNDQPHSERERPADELQHVDECATATGAGMSPNRLPHDGRPPARAERFGGRSAGTKVPEYALVGPC
jgi:hypothetical protein